MLDDVGAERYCLAAAYKYPDAFLDVDTLISPLSFTDEVNQTVWKTIKSLRDDNLNANLDLPSLVSKARELNLDSYFADPQTKDYIKALVSLETDISNVIKFASIVKNLEVARGLLDENKLTEKDILAIKGTESIDYICNLAQARVFDYLDRINVGQDQGVVHVSEAADEYFQYLINNDPTDIVGISSGNPIWDSFIGGFRRQTVTLEGARSGVGKSQRADNICKHIAGSLNIPTLYLDTEMDIKGHWHRLWSNVAEVDSKEIENSKFKLDPDKLKKVKDAKDYINSIPYYYRNISGKPFEDTLAFIRRWLIKTVGYDENGRINDCLVVYDYLKMMSGEGISNDMKEHQILGFQMTNLSNFAQRFDIPIYSFVQLNRDGIDKESTDIISQSDRLLWLASSLSIYKPKSEDELASSSEAGNMKLIVVKNRYGSVNSPGEYINMKFEGKYSRVTEGKLSSQVRLTPPSEESGRHKPKSNAKQKPERGEAGALRPKAEYTF